MSGTHRIRSYDGVELQAYSVRPVALPGKKFPVLVFVNSWMCQGNEYTNVIDAWAKKGYVCLQYAARGWYLSGGKVDVGGPDNTRDATAVIDFMLREFKEQADPHAIAVGGVSYGAVVAQLVAAHDSRVRVVLALSGCSDALADLYWHHSVALIWGELLVWSAKIDPLDAREAPSVSAIWHDLRNHSNMDTVAAWAANRSMTHVLERMHANRAHPGSVPLLSSSARPLTEKPALLCRAGCVHVTQPRRQSLPQRG